MSRTVPTRIPLATLLVALAAPAAASAAAPPQLVPLDAAKPVAAAASGTTVAWLRQTSKRGDRQLVVRDAGAAAPRVVAQRVPRNAVGLAIGTDAHDAPTAVLSTSGGRLYRLPLDGSAPAARLPSFRAGGHDAAPGLLHGTVSFVRSTGKGARAHRILRAAALDGRRSTAVTPVAAGYDATETAPLAGGRIALVAVRVVGYRQWAELRLVSPEGRRSRVLTRTSAGGAADVGIGPLTVTPDGNHLTASRWQEGGGHPWDTTTWHATGRVQERHRQAAPYARELPLGAEGTAVLDPDLSRDAPRLALIAAH
ncbi:hypothetical protein [Patulibacter sp. SYSU D01012]|uniref:hypothetical protein n=1 Tax=Patulibacter sp. SYSU D01012 TaxID=2817381 RepID=UPI001B318061|nr:hypothetical protein [Patulibacter sp. SYSU D01012]